MPAPRQRNARVHKPWEPVYPPGPVIDVPAWTDEARCAEVGGDEFFPEKGGSSRKAKKVCMTCEVRVMCLEWALSNDERFGVWGGKSERERREIKRDRAATTALKEAS
jgi:WhiB family redox-sensing transcriptional regulator